ncbi:hypothetical protein ACEPAG_3703 [Sanghuangporus baumii]
MAKFKVVKARVNATDALVAATSIASIVAHVSDMLQFIPARAAASVILVILKTVQEIDNNKVAVYKLARRSAKILVELKVRMTGRWETAPKALLENIRDYEKVLIRIRDFMQDLTKIGRLSRLLRKGSIEAALSDFHELLDEAERTFQMASLVEIHYTVGVLAELSGAKIDNTVEKESNESRFKVTEPGADSSSPGTCDSLRCDVSSNHIINGKNARESLPPAYSEKELEDETEEIRLHEELKELERFGFRQYHQSDLRLLCEVKSSRSDSFWKHTTVADAREGRFVVKRYDYGSKGKSDSLKRWLHDIKILKNIYHPNLPQLIGYSSEKSPSPFIILAQAKLRDPKVYLLNALRNMSISECTVWALKMYRDVSETVLYVQRQLSFDDREAQVFISETNYALDTVSGKVIVGIPPPPERNSYRGFGYPLSESLLDTTLKFLPSERNLSKEVSSCLIDLQNKLAHVRALATVLLPTVEQKPELSNVSEALLEDADFDFGSSSMPLSRVRRQALNSGMHEFAWHAAIHSCRNTFAVGDIGFISCEHRRVPITDLSRFDHFVKVGNLVDEVAVQPDGMEPKEDLRIVREVTGSYGRWVNGFHKSEEAWPFPTPGDVEGWPVSLFPGAKEEVHVRHTARLAIVNEAWCILLEQARNRAISLGIEPHELILVTKTVFGQIYKVHDWHPARPTLPVHPTPFTQGHSHFSHGYHHHHHQSQLPRMLYLFTSRRPDFEPFMAENSTAMTCPRKPPEPRGIALSTAWQRPEAFIGYIQLSVEDFVS